MRGVVCRHEVEDAALQRSLDAGAVLVRTERRVHAVEALEGRDEVVGEGEVVRGGVGGDVRPALEEADECCR